jgi:hypothetical protein
LRLSTTGAAGRSTPGPGFAARALQLERIGDELATSGRAAGIFPPTQAISAGSSADTGWAVSTDRRSGECGLAVLRGSQRRCDTYPSEELHRSQRDVAEELAARLAVAFKR